MMYSASIFVILDTPMSARASLGRKDSELGVAALSLGKLRVKGF